MGNTNSESFDGKNHTPNPEGKKKLISAILYLTGFKTELEIEAFLNHGNKPKEDDEKVSTFSMLIHKLLENGLYERYISLAQYTPADLNSPQLIEEARITILGVCATMLGKNRRIYGKDITSLTDHAVQLVRERIMDVMLLSTGFDTIRDLEAFLNGKERLQTGEELRKVNELADMFLEALSPDEVDKYLHDDLIEYSINLVRTPREHEVSRKLYLELINPTIGNGDYYGGEESYEC